MFQSNRQITSDQGDTWALWTRWYLFSSCFSRFSSIRKKGIERFFSPAALMIRSSYRYDGEALNPHSLLLSIDKFTSKIDVLYLQHFSLSSDVSAVFATNDNRSDLSGVLWSWFCIIWSSEMVLLWPMWPGNRCSPPPLRTWPLPTHWCSSFPMFRTI